MADGSSCVITYGGYAIGGAGGVFSVDGEFSVVDVPEEMAVSFRAFTIQGSLSAMDTAATAFVTAMRQIRKDLTIVTDGETMLTVSHSGNTGFDSQADATLVEDYGLARVYDVRIRFGRPADYSSLDGRRASSITVGWTAAKRKILTIEGVYTALDSDAATTVWNDAIDTYATSVQTAVDATATWDLVDDFTDYPETDKVLTFRRTYEQRFIDVPDAALIGQTLKLTFAREAPGDSETIDGETVVRMGRWLVEYGAYVDSDTNTTADEIQTLWQTKALEWVVQQVTDIAGHEVFVTRDEPDYDPVQNYLAGTVELEGVLSSGPVRWEVSTKATVNTGLQARAIHTGRPLDKYAYAGPADVNIVVREAGVWVGPPPRRPTDTQVMERFQSLLEEEVVEIRGVAFDDLAWIPKVTVNDVQPIDLGLDDISTGQLRTWTIQREYTFQGFTEVVLTGLSRTLVGAGS